MAKSKRVLWLIKGLGAGGAERLLSTAIPYLNRQAFQYEVAYLLPSKSDLVPEFARANIPVYCLDASRPYNPMVGLRLVKLLKDREIDILHIHLPYTAILGRLCAQVAGVRSVIYTEHNVHEMYHPVTRFFNRLTCPLDSATIAVSDEVRRSSLDWKMLRPKRIQTIPRGADLEDIERRVRDVDKGQLKASLGISQGDLVVGNVAHIRPEKGQGYLIEAAARVLQQYPKTTFIVIGRAKEEEALQRLVARATELGIRDHVIFTGFQEDAVRFMSIFDVFVLSSLYEGLLL